jgi:hypothetical protein
VRLNRFLRVQIENNYLWAGSWVLKGALTGQPLWIKICGIFGGISK